MEYWLNRDYIAQVLCVNKSRPEMQCHGKCHLKKQLEKDAQQEKNNNTGKERFEVMFVDNLQQLHTAPPLNFIENNDTYRYPFSVTPVFSVFHPPQA